MRSIAFYIKYLFIVIKFLLFEQKDRKNLYKENKKLDIIICGNGPSLNESMKDRDILINKKIMTVNNSINTDYFTDLKPDFHIIADSNYRKKYDANFVKRYGNLLKDMQTNFIESVKKIDRKIRLLVPLHSKGSNFIKILASINPNVKLTYYNMTPINLNNKLGHIIYKNNIGMPTAENVLNAAIFNALNIGFKTIYLLGADHSWHEDFQVGDDNIIYTADKHFYKNKEEKRQSMIDGDQHSKLYQEFFSLYKAFRAHIYLENYSMYLGKKIYNASKKSYIDAYERYKF